MRFKEERELLLVMKHPLWADSGNRYSVEVS